MAFQTFFLTILSFNLLCCHGFVCTPCPCLHNLQNFFLKKENFKSSRCVVMQQDDDVWSVRRKIIRTSIRPLIQKSVEEPALESNFDAEKMQFVVTALLGTLGILVFRFGGRLAFMSFLGLDFLQDASLNDRLNEFVVTFENFKEFRIVFFFLCWVIVKIACFDFGTIILALSSGILFGGIWQVRNFSGNYIY